MKQQLFKKKKKKRTINHLNKPIYIGTIILDLSKVLTQEFHQNNIKNKYGDKAKMSLAYTDNVMYKIETENVYEDIYKDKQLFDFSSCPNASKYYSGANNFVVGKMRDEKK